MALKKRQLEQLFRKLEVEQKEFKHHISGFIIVNGRRVLPVHYSFGRGDVDGVVLERFRKSLHLDRDQFHELIGCHMDRESYIDIIVEKGLT
jgi:hypothetical protein